MTEIRTNIGSARDTKFLLKMECISNVHAEKIKRQAEISLALLFPDIFRDNFFESISSRISNEIPRNSGPNSV